MLGKKQSISNDDWIEAMANIESLVSFQELKQLEEKTIADIQSVTYGKKVAYAWSAGKDSIVLGKVCEKAGIKDCFIGMSNLEYTDFVKWVHENKPLNCEVINTGQDLEWLSKNQKMLFPQKSEIASKWFSIVQHTAQRQYFNKHNLDMIILGRRRADGNYIGKGQNFYTDGKGVTRYSPIAYWRHEDILAYIHYYNLPLPPIYSWKNGYKCGTHSWAARQHTGSVQNGWQEVYDIEKQIVINASNYIQSAKDFLTTGGQNANS